MHLVDVDVDVDSVVPPRESWSSCRPAAAVAAMARTSPRRAPSPRPRGDGHRNCGPRACTMNPRIGKSESTGGAAASKPWSTCGRSRRDGDRTTSAGTAERPAAAVAESGSCPARKAARVLVGMAATVRAIRAPRRTRARGRVVSAVKPQRWRGAVFGVVSSAAVPLRAIRGGAAHRA